MIATVAISALASICVTALCMTLFFRNYADPQVMIAVIGIANNLTGSLGTFIGMRAFQQHPPPDVTVSTEPPSAEVKQPQPEIEQ